MSWETDPLSLMQCRSMSKRLQGRGAKSAKFHMVASGEKQCEGRGRINGARGEIEDDSRKIRVYEFATTHHPPQASGGHGAGDSGLAMALFNAVEAVKQGTLNFEDAQQEHIGCTLTDVVRGHAMVFAAEEAQRQKIIVKWARWWRENVATFFFTDSAYEDTRITQTEPK